MWVMMKVMIITGSVQKYTISLANVKRRGGKAQEQ
jgi:hypothetical protein